jgi:hypothetical protein
VWSTTRREPSCTQALAWLGRAHSATIPPVLLRRRLDGSTYRIIRRFAADARRMPTMISREFNQDVAPAKRAALESNSRSTGRAYQPEAIGDSRFR